MLNFDIEIFKCQLHGKHILGDKRLVVQLFSSTIANNDCPLELHVKLIADSLLMILNLQPLLLLYGQSVITSHAKIKS